MQYYENAPILVEEPVEDENPQQCVKEESNSSGPQEALRSELSGGDTLSYT